MSYTVYDFSESLDRAGLPVLSVDKAIAGWGESTEGWGEWHGGFVVSLKNGEFAKIEGWCDTSGWGCQDGAEVSYSETLPSYPDNADIDPVDLNRYLKGEIEKW